MKKNLLNLLSLFLLTVMVSCNAGSSENQLSDDEKKNGWTLLFDGKTTAGWHIFGKDANTPSNWKVDSGMLYRNPKDTFGIADLTSDKEYENYDFTFDWKIAKEGNSGVFIDVQETPDTKHAWETGPEYQLLDSSHVDNKILTKRAGCLYGFGPQKTPVKPIVADEWNHSRIVQDHGKIQFYLNDALTAEADFTSQAWKDSVATSGFKDFPQFGKNTKGHLSLQDWASPVYFKNIKIKQL